MSELLSVLKGVVLFQDLADQDLKEVAQRITRRTFKLGEYLFRAGAARTELMMIQSGEVEIFQGVGEVQKTVARLGEGNFIGEGAMLGDEPYGTSCRAVGKSGGGHLRHGRLCLVLGGAEEGCREDLQDL